MLLQIYLAQVRDAQRTKLIAFDIRFTQDIILTKPQGKAGGFVNYFLLSLLV